MWWVVGGMVLVIVVLWIYLDRRGATGAGDNFASSEADNLPWLGADYGQIKKKR